MQLGFIFDIQCYITKKLMKVFYWTMGIVNVGGQRLILDHNTNQAILGKSEHCFLTYLIAN